MTQYPDYVYKTLAQARREGQWHAHQADAAALCFDILADFPDCEKAKELIYELFCDEWTIYDNRVAIQQNIDEWDDRPWQQRRRLALSYRFMSRWDDKYQEELLDEEGPSDVRDILQDGKMELLGAYCLGDDECTNYAWTIFAEALKKTKDPQATLLWIGMQYADLGFFADAAEAVGESCSRFNNSKARRLLAEIIWWRDNAHRIPWIPPASDGSRYDRMMESIDPSAPKTKDYVQRVRNENQKERIAPYRPTIDKKLANLFTKSIPDKKEILAPTLIDWSFLDKDDGQPAEPADWVKKRIRMLEKWKDELHAEILKDLKNMHKWTRNIEPPSTPKKYDPNEPPFDAKWEDDLDENV